MPSSIFWDARAVFDLHLGLQSYSVSVPPSETLYLLQFATLLSRLPFALNWTLAAFSLLKLIISSQVFPISLFTYELCKYGIGGHYYTAVELSQLICTIACLLIRKIRIWHSTTISGSMMQPESTSLATPFSGSPSSEGIPPASYSICRDPNTDAIFAVNEDVYFFKGSSYLLECRRNLDMYNTRHYKNDLISNK